MNNFIIEKKWKEGIIHFNNHYDFESRIFRYHLH